MAEPKDGESFFRKVVRFVANPATDWSEIAAKTEEAPDPERTELKAMIERKRRNDFVRKREFDVLRKLRREGLSPEQLAALGGSSRGDDSEARLSESARSEAGVKEKIDEIEQQMVGDATVRPSERFRPPSVPTMPLPYPTSDSGQGPLRRAPNAAPPFRPSTEHVLDPLARPPAAAPAALSTTRDAEPRPAMPAAGARTATVPSLSTLPPQPAAGPAAKPPAPPPSPVAIPALDLTLDLDGSPLAMEVREAVHDPELDEAVIAFANADFALCEQAIAQRIKRGAPRHGHAETWLVMFDLYRATGDQARFEALALDYANEFGSSAPQWFSLPKLVAEAAAHEERPIRSRASADVGWISPMTLDIDAVAKLRSTTLQLPLPWVLDWSALQRVETEAAGQLRALFRQWATQKLELRWIAADQLFNALADAAPTGVRDADPAFWMARLEALRLVNRPDQFDEAAIDYCVTYEVSPPSWEKALCVVRVGGTSNSTAPPPMSIVSEVSMNFLESGLTDEPQGLQPATAVELSGQLAGDISPVLQKIDRKIGTSPLVQVSCARLIRVDFIAAGDLLNWVLAKRGENRSVTFTDSHRLIALFFGAMGINEHAKVQLARG